MDRLDKILGGTGRYSRSEARTLITGGLVSVDGRIVRKAEEKISRGSTVLVRGESVETAEFVYYMLNKPADYISAVKDELYPAVTKLLPDFLQKRGLQPVGRLDVDVTGLLILTDDGQTAHRLMSPKSGIRKVYEIYTDGPLLAEHCTLLAGGVTMRDGTQYQPAQLVIDENNDLHGFVSVTEGKYHEVKNLIAVCGRHIASMSRIRIGELTLDPELQPGQGRFLSPEEIRRCFC